MPENRKSIGQIVLKTLQGLFTLAILVAAVLFTVTNTALVSVDLWPFPMVLEEPLYRPVLIGLGAGLFLGSVMAGVATIKWRARAGARARALKAAKKREDALNVRIQRLEAKARDRKDVLALPSADAA